MFRNDLFGSYIRRLFKRHRALRPRRHYHAGTAVLRMSLRTVYKIANAVNHPDVHSNVFTYGDADGPIRNKSRLCRHNCPSCGRLRQFIGDPCLFILIFNCRQHKHIHKSLNKRRFSRPDRANYPDIDISSCPIGYILVNARIRHYLSSISVVCTDL